MPQYRYGWQLYAAQRAGPYADLPAVLFNPLVPVDVLVVFGLNDTILNFRRGPLPALAGLGWNYEPVKQLDVYFDDRTRPELIWHWFRDRPYDKSIHQIYIYRLAK